MAQPNINFVFGVTGQDNVARGAQKIEQQLKKTTTSAQKMGGALLDQANKMGMSEREYIRYSATLQGATREQKQNMLSVFDAIQAQDQLAMSTMQAEAQKRQEQLADAKRQKTIDRVINSLREENATLGMTSDQLQLRKARLNGATQAQLNEIKALQKSNAEKDRAVKKSGNLNGQLRLMRGGFGQVGHQIQDVSVQLQMGTDALLVFGQQGSQIASLFGQNGAMIGAVISVGAAVATYFKASLDDSSVSVRELEKTISELDSTMHTTSKSGVKVLSEEFVELAKNSRNLAEIQLRGNLATAQDVLITSTDQLSESLEELTVKQYKFGQMAKGNKNLLNDFSKEMGISKDQALQLKTAIENFNNGVEGSVDPLLAMINNLAKLPTATKDLQLLLAPIFKTAMQFKNAEERVEFFRKALSDLPAALAAAEGSMDNLNGSQNDFGSTVERIIGELSEQNAILTIATQNAYSAAEAHMVYKLELAGLGEEAIQAAIKLRRLNQEMRVKLDPPKPTTDPEAEQRRQERNFSMLKRSLMNEQDLIKEDQRIKMSILDKQYPEQLRKQKEYLELKQKIDEQAASASKIAAANASASIAGSAATSLETLSEIFSESKGIAKAMFVANQAVAIANAIMNAEAGSTRALAEIPAPYNMAVAGTIKAMGYAAAGAIAGQTLASFEGGGITFNGVRSGGMDGKGGRMAVVHPNEKITDLEKDGSSGQPVNVSFNISAVDSKGIDQLLFERRGMITSMVQKAVNNRGKRIM